MISKTKTQRKPMARALALLLCLAMMLTVLPIVASAKTLESDTPENVFFYLDTGTAANGGGDRVLLAVFTMDELYEAAHGPDGTKDTAYSASFIDNFPTETYLQGIGLTIPELLSFVEEKTGVEGASLTYAGNDRIYFSATDGAVKNHYAKNLTEVERYYFPGLYGQFDQDEDSIIDIEAAKAGAIPAEPYIAVASYGGRIFEDATLMAAVEANGGVITDSLINADLFDMEQSLRFVVPQTEAELESATHTMSEVTKWVYSIRLVQPGGTDVVSQGTVADPTVKFTLDGTTLTITATAEEGASLYFSSIGGVTSAPILKYDEPLVIENYNAAAPFNITFQAVREGYVSSAAVTANSSNITTEEPEEPDNTAFGFAMNASANAEVGTEFSVAAALTADSDTVLYGAEYRIAVPEEYFSVGAVTANTSGGWTYGSSSEGGNTYITFTFLDTVGAALTAGTAADIATVALTPIKDGEAEIAVDSAVVTRADATAYETVSAPGFTIAIDAGAAEPGDPTVWDGSIDTSWYNSTDTSFEIYTAAEFAGFAAIVNNKPETSEAGAVTGTDANIPADDFLGKTVYLMTDIDLGGIEVTAGGLNGTAYTAPVWSGQMWTPIASNTSSSANGSGLTGRPFKGTFDGGYHTVSNMYCVHTTDTSGLFGDLGQAGIVKNVIVGSGYVSGVRFTAGVVGRNWGEIYNCANFATVDTTGDRSGGGIAGASYDNGHDPVIKNCYNAGLIMKGDRRYSGGIADDNEGIIENCFNIGTGRQKFSPYDLMGGIVGGGRSSGTLINTYSLLGEGLPVSLIGANTTIPEGSAMLTLEEMQSDAFVLLLGDAFNADDPANPINAGFPVLKGQGGVEVKEPEDPDAVYTLTLTPGTTDNLLIGETLDINVNISGDDYLGAQIVVRYDTDLFDFAGYSNAVSVSNFKVTPDAEAGEITISAMNATDNITEGTFITLSFSAKELGSGEFIATAAFTVEKAEMITIEASATDVLIANVEGTDATIVAEIEVAFYAVDDAVISSESLPYGSGISAPEADDVDYFNFIGWRNGSSVYSGADIAQLALTTDNWTFADYALSFTAAYEAKSFNVSLGDGLDGSDTATYGTDYIGTITGYDEENYEYSVTYAGIDDAAGSEFSGAATISDGTFTIFGGEIKGDLTVNVSRNYIGNVITYEDYVTGYTLVLMGGDPESDSFTYDGNAMLYVETLGGFAYLTEGTVSAEDAALLVEAGSEPATVLAATYDVNGSGSVNLADAGAALGCYRVAYSVEDRMAMYLLADVNGDFKVDTDDYTLIFDYVA